MTMISDLQSDMVEEILSRVPLKFVRAVRLTCKKWNFLSKNRSFSKMQIDKEKTDTKEGESKMIVMRGRKLYLMSVVNNGKPDIEFKGTLTCVTEQLYKGSQILNCEGLLLCIFNDFNENTKLMVWNPYCLQPKWFEPRCSYKQYIFWDPCCYALGYAENNKNKSCGRSYKILRFIDNNSFSWYEIYDFESDSWKTLDVNPNWLIRYEHGVSVKGNTYWCVTEKNTDNFHVLCFDFTRERFGPLILLPYYIEAGKSYNVHLLSCVREEKLVALLHHRDMPNVLDVEVWITTEIDAEKLTWNKFFTVNMDGEISQYVDSFIIDEERKLVIVGYGDKIGIFGESEYFTELDVFEQSDNDYDDPYLCAYVPSLAQIEQAAGGKMIEQDNAEKRGCDEKKVRLAAYERLMESEMYKTKNNKWIDNGLLVFNQQL